MKRLSGAGAQARGLAFEKEVARLFQRLGYWRVRRDVKVVDSYGNHSQIDVVAGLVRRVYVECKCYSGPVPLSDVAKFASVLELNGVPLSRGIFITNSWYVPRATTIGVRTVDGAELARWRQQARRRQWKRWLVPLGVAGLVVATQVHY